MLDMGFVDQITRIFRFAPPQRQTLFFSATFPEGVRRLSNSLLNDPEEIVVEAQHAAAVIKQSFYEVPGRNKVRATIELLARHQPESTLIFCNTKDQVRAVCAELNRAGLHALAFHGDLEQRDRTLVLVRFSNQSCTVLVATDVAARGIDIDTLGAVINYDLPLKPETYVHRIGRTGRAGAEGLAFSLVTPGEDFRIRAINDTMRAQHELVPTHFRYGSEHPELEPPMVTLSINGGRKNKISAGDILGALTSEGGIKGADVGKIDRMDHLTFVAVRRKSVNNALRMLQSAPIKGRRYRAMIND